MNLNEAVVIAVTLPGVTVTTEAPVASISVPIVTGPQGIPGLQNVYVQITQPSSPNTNDIWIQI